MEREVGKCSWCGDEDGVFAFILQSNGKESECNLGAECWYQAIVKAIGKPKTRHLTIVKKRKSDEELN